MVVKSLDTVQDKVEAKAYIPVHVDMFENKTGVGATIFIMSPLSKYRLGVIENW